MPKSFSPLRYPGGKTKIYEKVKKLILKNGFGDRTYVEPFAGGFGIGIGLLSEGIVQSAILNDLDIHIFHFWQSVLYDTENLLRLITDTPITIEERERQKKLYNDSDTDSLHDGFATLFLNRVNYSGIIKGGPIGGISQTSKFKIDCRFKKDEIANKIIEIAKFKDSINLFNEDARKLIFNHLLRSEKRFFLNIDPPYVVKGSQLYTNFFTTKEHVDLSVEIIKHLDNRFPWIVTYDVCDLVIDLYKQFYSQIYNIVHNAGGSVVGKEIVFTNLSNTQFVWE
jgi:DNA adenine methylase